MCYVQQFVDLRASRDELLCSLVTGYVKNGQPQRALTLYQKMQEDKTAHPIGPTFVALLKACSMLQDLEEGSKLHADISKRGLLESDAFVFSTLVDMYMKCGALDKAQEVFDNLSVKDVVSWTVLIAGYVDSGHGEEALRCLDQMQDAKVSPNSHTLVCSLKACGSIGSLIKGEQVYIETVKKGFDHELPVGNSLVDMYSKLGLLAIAQHVLNKLPERNKVSWTALITGYAEHGQGEEVLHNFHKMQQEGVPPDAFTYVSGLKACSSIVDIVNGQKVHSEATLKGFEREVVIGNILVDMYAKCGFLVDAQEIFDKLPSRTVVPFTVLITEYAEQGYGEKALACYSQMVGEGITPDTVTYVCTLKACGSVEAVEKGQKLHTEITVKGLETETLLGNNVVDMYVKCGLLEEAQVVFNSLSSKDAVSWTTLLAGYSEHAHNERALLLLGQMQQSRTSMNIATFVCSLKACSSVGASIKGMEVHADVIGKGFEEEVIVGNILVDMYVNFGLLAEAQEVFDNLPFTNVISWNALISGYGQVGEIWKVSDIFIRMIEEGVKPDNVTYISVLNACSHVGQVDYAVMCFIGISKNGGVPIADHYNSFIDVLGRAGLIDKAVACLKGMPLHPDIVLWHIVLGACEKWSNVELGRRAFEHAACLDAKNGAAYVYLSNLYLGGGMEEGSQWDSMIKTVKSSVV